MLSIEKFEVESAVFLACFAQWMTLMSETLTGMTLNQFLEEGFFTLLLKVTCHTTENVGSYADCSWNSSSDVVIRKDSCLPINDLGNLLLDFHFVLTNSKAISSQPSAWMVLLRFWPSTFAFCWLISGLYECLVTEPTTSYLLLTFKRQDNFKLHFWSLIMCTTFYHFYFHFVTDKKNTIKR